MTLLSLHRLIGLVLCVAALNAPAAPLPGVEKNIFYGTAAGTALGFDVYTPAQQNGAAIVFIPGSGWMSAPESSAPPLSDSSQVATYVPPLTQAGYTVFVVNYRGMPSSKYPAAVIDTQRAVRFIRHNAARFGIDPARLGGAGGSSGAHLVGLLGTLDGAGDPADPDPVNRQSAKLQAVVARAMPADFLQNGDGKGLGAITNFMGVTTRQLMRKDSNEQKAAQLASPINHVTPASAPFLLMHGDVDDVVPIAQSEHMEAALKKAGVPVKLLRVEGAGHHPNFKGATSMPDYKGEMVKWFDLYLRKGGADK
ncbi:MAG: alpha/beta hydrolase [Massilia sp.]